MKKYGKKNLFKSLIGMCMGLCMLLAVSMTGYAADGGDSEDGTEIMPMSSGSRTTCTLNISSGTATAKTSVRGESADVTKISIKMELQKKSSSGTYKTIATWSGSKSASSYTLSKKKSVSKGTYRVKASVTCYKGSKSESTVNFSKVRTY